MEDICRISVILIPAEGELGGEGRWGIGRDIGGRRGLGEIEGRRRE